MTDVSAQRMGEGSAHTSVLDRPGERPRALWPQERRLGACVRGLVVLMGLGILVPGCVEPPGPPASGPMTSTHGSASDGADEATGATQMTPGSSSEGDTGSVSSDSAAEESDGSSGEAVRDCDLFAQDCPEGQKCTWAGDPDWSFFEYTLCVPLDPDPLPDGSPCTYDLDDPFAGIDRCGLGAICAEGYTSDGAWDGHASCVQLCKGSVEHRYCDSGMACLGTRALWICVPHCDPFVQDCGEGERCDLSGADPLCIGPSGGDLGPGEPCDWPSDCALGLSCRPGSTPGCEYECCTPFCDRSDPQAECPFAGQVCVEPYEGIIPLGAEKVGVCLMGDE